MCDVFSTIEDAGFTKLSTLVPNHFDLLAVDDLRFWQPHKLAALAGG